MFNFQLPSWVCVNHAAPSDPLLWSDSPLLVGLVEWRSLFEESGTVKQVDSGLGDRGVPFCIYIDYLSGRSQQGLSGVYMKMDGMGVWSNNLKSWHQTPHLLHYDLCFLWWVPSSTQVRTEHLRCSSCIIPAMHLIGSMQYYVWMYSYVFMCLYVNILYNVHITHLHCVRLPLTALIDIQCRHKTWTRLVCIMKCWKKWTKK